MAKTELFSFFQLALSKHFSSVLLFRLSPFHISIYHLHLPQAFSLISKRITFFKVYSQRANTVSLYKHNYT